jgi:hypothetical protein
MAVLNGLNTSKFFSSKKKACVSNKNDVSTTSVATVLPDWNPPSSISCGGKKTAEEQPVIDLSADEYEAVTFGKITFTCCF